jgi:hypothetical protein
MGFNLAFKGLKSASNEIRKISASRRKVVENCALLAITQRVVVIPYRRFGTTYYCTLRYSPEERGSRNTKVFKREGLRIP